MRIEDDGEYAATNSGIRTDRSWRPEPPVDPGPACKRSESMPSSGYRPENEAKKNVRAGPCLTNRESRSPA